MQGPDPRDYQPPLRWYSHLWRYALALAIGVVVWIPVIEAQAEDHPGLFWLDLVLGILVFVLVAWRRRWPMTVAVIAVLATPFSSLAGGGPTSS